MKRKTLRAAGLVVACTLCAGAFSACGTSRQSVDCDVAKNYFVRNGVKDYSPRVMTSRSEFEKTFGMAATMGEDGVPTPIDFSKSNAVAVILPPTDIDTEIKVKSVKEEDGKLVVRYAAVEKGRPMSYTMVPCLLLKVDKKYGSNVEFVRQ